MTAGVGVSEKNKQALPRRVLCPWRVHPPASTLPAVARATAGRFVRCEWPVGCDVGVLRCSISGRSFVCRALATSREP